MEIPALVRRTLGDEDIEAAVNLGDEDVVCFTPTRTILYRGEGLLSDEGVEVYDHDVERLDVSEGRRKTAFRLQYVDRTEEFSVASGRGEPVLERLLTGILRTRGAIGPDEGVDGVFRFSELTMVVTEARLLKHIGSNVWDEEYEEYDFADVTGLEFEDGSVATQIVLSVAGRPQRIKVPSDDVGVLRQTLEGALFAYHDVGSLQQLNETVGQLDDQPAESATSTDGMLDDTISPLVGDDSGESDASADRPTPTQPDEQETADQSVDRVETSPTHSAERQVAERTERSGPDGRVTEQSTTGGNASAVSRGEFDAMQEELTQLRAAVERQGKLLEDQQETIERLIEELRKRH